MSEAFCAVVSSAMSMLLAVLGSKVDDVAEAVLVHTPAVGRITCTVTVALARKLRLPSAQLSTPATGAPQLPWVVAAPTKVDPGGSVSTRVMPIDESGPLLSTRIT